MPTTGILFDMDGVLIDSEPVICAAAIRALAEFGVTARPEDFLPFVGAGEDRFVGGVAELHGKVFVPAMKHRTYHWYLQLLPAQGRPFPGVHERLEELRRRGLRLAIASSADRIKVEANLHTTGLPPAWFGAVLTGDDVTRKKPEPDIYLAAARALGLAPAACCVVEDAVNGVLAAKRAGMRCVAVATSFPAAALTAAGADAVRPTLAEVTPADLGA